MKKAWRQERAILALLLACLCESASAGAAEAADVFSRLSLSQAKEQAGQDKKLLLLDFTASWCPPCQKMERTTWEDQEVKDWIKQNALAVQIDVDQNSSDTRALQVEAMPTLILFTPAKGGAEFGRKVGYQSPAELLRWLEGARSGKSKEELEKETMDGSDNAVFEGLGRARQCQTAGQYDEALNEYIRLWQQTAGGNKVLSELRTGLIAHELKQLVKSHPPARARLVDLRKSAEAADNRLDVVMLNGILDENARTLDWFDQVKDKPEARPLIARLSNQLVQVLYSACRWSDAATYLYGDPIKQINEYYKQAEAMKKPAPRTEVSKDFDPFPSMVLMLYGSYVGAGKEAQAQAIKDECLRLDDTQTMHEALDNMAQGMRQARKAAAKSNAAIAGAKPEATKRPPAAPLKGKSGTRH